MPIELVDGVLTEVPASGGGNQNVGASVDGGDPNTVFNEPYFRIDFGGVE